MIRIRSERRTIKNGGEKSNETGRLTNTPRHGG